MRKPNFVFLQVFLWLTLYLFLVLYGVQKVEDWASGTVSATIYVFFYVVAVYVQSHWLFPAFFRKNSYPRYVVLSLLLLLGVVTIRMYVEYEALFIRLRHHRFYDITFQHFAFAFITQLLASVFGVMLRVAFNYMSLLRRQEQLKNQQIMSELNLLKAQVQPHFLFNTLNNIYALAVAKSEQTPAVVAKLSDIMRYFVDEAPKERVPLQTVFNFLKNYIELEQIRLRYPVNISFEINVPNKAVLVPPMLLIPFVENIFKHGVDKTTSENSAVIALEVKVEKLHFTVKNTLFGESEGSWRGLSNLQKRLNLLFPAGYELEAKPQNDYFVASLEFIL